MRTEALDPYQLLRWSDVLWLRRSCRTAAWKAQHAFFFSYQEPPFRAWIHKNQLSLSIVSAFIIIDTNIVWQGRGVYYFLTFWRGCAGTRVGILLIWNAKHRQNQLLSAHGMNRNVSQCTCMKFRKNLAFFLAVMWYTIIYIVCHMALTWSECIWLHGKFWTYKIRRTLCISLS